MALDGFGDSQISAYIFASILDSKFSYNEAQGLGGGAYSMPIPALNISHSNFTHNEATFAGGGILLVRRWFSTLACIIAAAGTTVTRGLIRKC